MGRFHSPARMHRDHEHERLDRGADFSPQARGRGILGWDHPGPGRVSEVLRPKGRAPMSRFMERGPGSDETRVMVAAKYAPRCHTGPVVVDDRGWSGI